MSFPGPYIIAQWISGEIQTEEFESLRIVLERTLLSHLDARSEEEISEYAETLEENVFNQLMVIVDQLERTGTEPTFLLDGNPGTAFIKAHNVAALEVLENLKQLSPTDFESFCTDILHAMGANSYKVGGTGDGGVDFIATDLPVSELKHIGLRPCRPVVIGQAKRYTSNLVRVNEVRSFLGAAIHRFDEIRRFEERIGMFSPCVFAFWTTSDFNVNSRDFVTKSGIWALGGLTLSQLTIELNLNKYIRR